MNSKPIVMEHFSTVHTSFVVDFTFTNNITILMGDSEYAMIPFDMERVKAKTNRECKVIEGYEELKEWWENEE